MGFFFTSTSEIENTIKSLKSKSCCGYSEMPITTLTINAVYQWLSNEMQHKAVYLLFCKFILHFFDILLTAHLNIFILILTNLMHQIL